MNHFYKSIQGWFDFGNIYSHMVSISKDGAKFVEVGSWKGKSAAFMCVEIVNSGKKIQFDCVDLWTGLGEPGEYESWQSVQQDTLYEDFKKNMRPVENLYNPIKSFSHEAANLYKDNSLDFVFIDAGHAYHEVKRDILCWTPKVKVGGHIGGHDYTTKPGVKKSVDELVKNFQVNRSSWIVRI